MRRSAACFCATFRSRFESVHDMNHEHTHAAGNAIDPVCGMTVDKRAPAGTVEFEGQTYFFCSQHCVKKFRDDPVRYLAPAAQTLTQIGISRDPIAQQLPIAGREYTC